MIILNYPSVNAAAGMWRNIHLLVKFIYYLF